MVAVKEVVANRLKRMAGEDKGTDAVQASVLATRSHAGGVARLEWRLGGLGSLVALLAQKILQFGDDQTWAWGFLVVPWRRLRAVALKLL